MISGAGMGRDDGYHCDVLASGVNLFIVLFHPLVIYRSRFISCVMAIIISSHIHYHRPMLLTTPNIYKAAIFHATLERKTRIEPFVYHSISKGFEIVTCDVGILYCVVLSL